MKLLKKEDLAKLQAQDPYYPSGPGRELPSNELMVIVKFFTPDSSWTWYAVSASVDPQTGDAQLFGLVDGFEKELGYFWLSALETVKGPLGPHIERDLHWTPVPLSDLL